MHARQRTACSRRRVVLSELIEDPTEPIYSGGVGISRLDCCVLINAVVAKYPSVGKVGSMREAAELCMAISNF